MKNVNDPNKELLVGIVLQAIQDYARVSRNIVKTFDNPKKDNQSILEYLITYDECRKYFNDFLGGV